MKRLLVLSLSSLLGTISWAATNTAPEGTAGQLSDAATSAAPGTSENRSLALGLLKKRADMMARLRSYIWEEEVSTERNARYTDKPFSDLTGKSRMRHWDEFRTDGSRYSIRMRLWGNTRSAAILTPAKRSAYNRYLWDGKRSIAYIATVDTAGRVSIYTHRNEPESWPKTSSPGVWWLFWDCSLTAVPAKASALTVRTSLEPVGAAKCYVVDTVTPVTESSVSPPARFTVYDTVWLDPDRGYNIVQVTRLVKYERASTSMILDHVACKQIEGIWIPMEGQVRRYDVFSNDDYDRLTNHVQITKIILNPDHQALRSFVPDDIKNGAWVALDPDRGMRIPSARLIPSVMPLWQDGRVVAPQGRILLDCGLNLTNAAKPSPAGKN